MRRCAVVDEGSQSRWCRATVLPAPNPSETIRFDGIDFVEVPFDQLRGLYSDPWITDPETGVVAPMLDVMERHLFGG